mmetsp:Transcript_5931/g.11092  ORF Transcript_5931/g.11092 Transcript_5931/m.11092 type:complete len:326 (+) Transcript_5931:83-1060(+)
MRWASSFGVFVTVATCAVVASNGVTDAAVVAGYLPEWRHRFLDEDHEDRLRIMCSALTQLILFSLEVGPGGELAALDRFPDPERLERTKRACPDTQLILCFGGNSRSNAFSKVVQTPSLRQKFAENAVSFATKNGLAGFDWNWEYPSSQSDWEGLRSLISEVREAAPELTQTMAYYPDGDQELRLARVGMPSVIDYFHSMAYDQPGAHSTMELAKRTIRQAKSAGLLLEQVTLGLPFYARHVKYGEWKTYHDVLAMSEGSLRPDDDEYQAWYFNGPNTISEKTKLASKSGLAGVMIWESGQDSVDGRLHQTIRQALEDLELKGEL